MKLISKKGMAFYYKVSPYIFLGFGIFAIFFIASTADNLSDVIPVIIFFLVAIFVLKLFVKDFVEEVYDCGDFLLIKNRNTEEKIPFKNMKNVTHRFQRGGELLITLHLLYPGQFGSRITFISTTAGVSRNPFKTPLIVEELMQRVRTAESGATMNEFVMQNMMASHRVKSSVSTDRGGLIPGLVILAGFCGIMWWGWNNAQPPESVVQDYYQSIINGKDNCDFRSLFINRKVQYTNKVTGVSTPALEHFEAQVLAAHNQAGVQSANVEILSKELTHAVISAQMIYGSGRRETEVLYLDKNSSTWHWEITAIEKI
jgi:hypothetical protein